MVQEVDFQIGLMMDTLKECDTDKNTLIVFSSDHGEMLGAHGKLGKGNLYEEAARVPVSLLCRTNQNRAFL